MPEGHTVHRLAHTFDLLFLGQQVRVSSPQGRFAAGAALLDGRRVTGTSAWGKQMFLQFGPGDYWLRVHLGLYGAWTLAGDGTLEVLHAIGAPRRRVGEQETSSAAASSFPPGPRGQVRVRILGEHVVADLTGPTACEVVTDEERAAVVARLGPDPLRHDADPTRFGAALARTKTPIAVALMDQSVVAGVGNIYRAETLFRAHLAPMTLSRDVPAAIVQGMWSDLILTMGDGMRTGRIVTTAPGDRAVGGKIVRRTRQNSDGDPGAIPADQAFYVYQREDLPCRVCGTAIMMRELAGRKLYWCPTCQA